MRKRARITAALFTAALASIMLPRPALATANFPGEIQTHLGLAAQPPASCSLCHTTGSAGGKGTVNTPFGVSVRGHGAVANDPAALDSALDAMGKDGTDSDGDKVPDVTELTNGTNPNVNDVTVTTNDAGQTVVGEGGTGGGGSDAAPPPQYGCAVTLVGQGRGSRERSRDTSTDAPVALGLVTFSMMIFRMVERRRRRRG